MVIIVTYTMNFVENHKLTLIHHFSVGLKSCMGGAVFT